MGSRVIALQKFPTLSPTDKTVSKFMIRTFVSFVSPYLGGFKLF